MCVERSNSLAFNLAGATELFALVFNEQNNHENFDFNSTCVVQDHVGIARDDKSCCGVAPNRSVIILLSLFFNIYLKTSISPSKSLATMLRQHGDPYRYPLLH